MLEKCEECRTLAICLKFLPDDILDHICSFVCSIYMRCSMCKKPLLFKNDGVLTTSEANGLVKYTIAGGHATCFDCLFRNTDTSTRS